MIATPRSMPDRALFIGSGAPIIAFLVYLAYWFLYLYGPPGFYLALLKGLGIGVWPYPFLDLESVLTAIDCAREGVDVTLPNACMGGGLVQKSPLVLKAAALPLGPGQRVGFGLGLDALFLVSLFALPRPRRWREFWLLLLAALSSSTLFAIERANIDLAIYLLVLGGVLLLLRGRSAGLLGYVTLLGAAAIKFYPACLMLLAARERPGRLLAIALACLAAAALFLVSFWNDVGHIVVGLPQGNPFSGIFSASSLPLGIAYLVNGDDAEHVVGLATRVGSTILLLGFCVRQVRRLAAMILPDFRALAPRERMLLVAGSVSIAFCFFAAKNIHYRAIFLLLTLPGLWTLERGAENRASGERLRLASWIVVGLLWSGLVRIGAGRFAPEWLGAQGAFPVQFGIWMLRELVWWWLVSLLVSVILCFLWDAPLLAWALLARLRRYPAA